MEIEIEYIRERNKGILLTNSNLGSLWSDIKYGINANQTSENILECNWPEFKSAYLKISDVCKKDDIKIKFKNKETEEEINKYLNELEILKKPAKFNFKKEFVTFKRNLKKHQEKAVQALLRLPHGANFSVPGAGKTTATLFLHNNLEDSKNYIMIVCAPLNAFQSWKEDLKECFGDKFFFSEIRSGQKNIQEKFNKSEKFIILNYECLQNLDIYDAVVGFLINIREKGKKIHFVLDESHKIKNLESQKSRTIHELKHYTDRRDILSGTPNPNGTQDLESQFDFLYPSVPFNVNNLQHHLFARTTKSDLGLSPIKFTSNKIPMTGAQAALYSRCCVDTVRDLNESSSVSGPNSLYINDVFNRIRRNVIRLNQLASNPILIGQRMLETNITNNIEDPFWEDSEVGKYFEEIEREGDSGKILKACRIARDLKKQGKKCVIWSFFVNSVETIANRLSDIGATYIHGGIKVGDENKPDNREYRINKFNDPKSDCWVMVANFAACSEGINLHKSCDHAIYLDRDFNAVHFQQSMDRIHRLGNNNQKYIHILRSVPPEGAAIDIDFHVNSILQEKIGQMGRVLDDRNLTESSQQINNLMSIDDPFDFGLNLRDINQIIKKIRRT